MKVIEGGFKNKSIEATELGNSLRELADQIDKNEIEGFVCAYVCDGQPLMMMFGGWMMAVALASILQAETLEQSKN